MPDCFLVLLFYGEEVSEIELCLRLVWIQTQRLGQMGKRFIGAPMQQLESSQTRVCLPIVRLQAHRFAVLSERFFPVAASNMWESHVSRCQFEFSNAPNAQRIPSIETGYRLTALRKKKKPRCVLHEPGPVDQICIKGC
jgi:hypothetical protein